MFSIRKEGESFKSGINFQWAFGKRSYVGIHYVSVDFNTDTVKRWSARLRLWRIWPMLLCYKSEYNFWQNRLDYHDGVVISRVAFEDYKALKDSNERYYARLKRYWKAKSEECSQQT